MYGNEPTLSQALKQTFSSFIAEIHTCLPGKVDSYDITTHKATVKPLLKKKLKDGSELALPSITNVPVIWPRTQKNGRIMGLADKKLNYFKKYL